MTHPPLLGRRVPADPRRQFASIFLDGYHASIFSQFPGQLIGIHIHRVNSHRAILQQAIGESAIRCTNIQADLALRQNLKIFQRAFELESTPAGVFLQPAMNFQSRVLPPYLSRLCPPVCRRSPLRPPGSSPALFDAIPPDRAPRAEHPAACVRILGFILWSMKLYARGKTRNSAIARSRSAFSP